MPTTLVPTLDFKKPSKPQLNRSHPLARGLVGAWEFYEGAGEYLNDVSGYGNRGTLTNGPSWVRGDGFSSALDFDGSDDFVDCGSSVLLDSNNWAISAWINRRAGGVKRVIAWYGNGPTLYVDGGGFAAIVHGGAIDLSQSIASIPIGVWTYLVITRSGSVARIWQNGVMLGESTSFSATYSADTSVRIGNSTAFGENFPGLIDDVRFYSRMLSVDEIRWTYQDPWTLYRPTRAQKAYFYLNSSDLSPVTATYSGRGIGRGLTRGVYR